MSNKAQRRMPAEVTATGWYVYGIVPADVELADASTGVGDPPGRMDLVRQGDIAALVSEVRLDMPLGQPQDLMAHQQILDATATAVPVLPMRFGAVLADRDDVAQGLLTDNHDEFAAALGDLEGLTEYVVHGRYIEDELFSEILSENPDAARLREQTRGEPEVVARDGLIQLGEIVNSAVEAKRAADTDAALGALKEHCVSITSRPASHEHDAVQIAALVETRNRAEWEETVEELARGWAPRMSVRLLGPLAPYDFVKLGQPS